MRFLPSFFKDVKLSSHLRFLVSGKFPGRSSWRKVKDGGFPDLFFKAKFE